MDASVVVPCRPLLCAGLALGVLAMIAGTGRADILVSRPQQPVRSTEAEFVPLESLAPAPTPMRTKRVARREDPREALVRRFGVELTTLIFGYYSWRPLPTQPTPLGTTSTPKAPPKTTPPVTQPPTGSVSQPPPPIAPPSATPPGTGVDKELLPPPPPTTFNRPAARSTVGLPPPTTAVPEPTALVSAALGASMAGAFALRRRRQLAMNA